MWHFDDRTNNIVYVYTLYKLDNASNVEHSFFQTINVFENFNFLCANN